MLTPEQLFYNYPPEEADPFTKPSYRELAWWLEWASCEHLGQPDYPAPEDVFERITEVLERLRKFGKHDGAATPVLIHAVLNPEWPDA